MFDFYKMDELRKKRGIKQSFIAKAINRTPTIYQDWKLSKSIPNSEQLEVIANILGTTINYLTEQSEQTENPPTVSGEGTNPIKTRIMESLDYLSDDHMEMLLAQIDMLRKEKEHK